MNRAARAVFKAKAFRSAPLAGALLFVGCVSGTDIEGLHRHVGEVEKKVDAVAQQSSSKEEVARLNEAIGKQATVILRSNADLGTKFDELTRELQVLAGRLEDANRRLTALSQQLAETQSRGGAGGGAAVLVPTPTGGPGDAGAPAGAGPAAAAAAGAAAGAVAGSKGAGLVAPMPGGGSPAPDVLYRQATADYQKGQFDLARQGFEEYVQSYPKTDLADDAAYWVGECYMAQKKWREAIGAFDGLVKGWPTGNKVPSARLKKAVAHLELGEKAQAIVQLQAVVHEYPGSDEAKSARQRLKALGSDTR